MLKIYRILSIIGVGIWFPSLAAYLILPEYRRGTTYLLVMLGVMIYGLAHVAGMKYYKEKYEGLMK